MKKVLFLFFALIAFSYGSSSDENYQPIDVTEATISEEIRDLIEFSLESILKHAVEKGLISSESVFTLTKINSIEEDTKVTGKYRFDCEISEAAGVKITVKFVVSENTEKNTKFLHSFSYNIVYPSTQTNNTVEDSGASDNVDFPNKNETSVANQTNYAPVSLEEFYSVEGLEGLFTYTFNGVVEIIKKKSPDAKGVNVSAPKINNIFKRSGNSGEYYKFNCSSINSLNVSLNVVFEVFHQLQSFNYTLEIPDGPAPGTNNSSGSNNTSVEELDPTEVSKDPEVKKAFDYGVGRIVEIAVNRSGIPQTQYNVVEIERVAKNNVIRGVNYLFATRLANEAKTVEIFTNFTVFVNRNGTMSLPAYYYHYKIKNVTKPSPNPGQNDYVKVNASEISQSKEIESVLAFGIERVIKIGISQGKIPNTSYTRSKIENVLRRPTKNGNSYKCKVALKNANNVNLSMSFTVNYNTQTQEKSMSAYSYKVTNIKSL